MRNTHMDTMETTMVNLASPAARRAFGREKEAGQNTREKTEHHRRTSAAMAAAPWVSPKIPARGWAVKKRITHSVPMAP